MIKRLFRYFQYKRKYEEMCVEFGKMAEHLESYQEMFKRAIVQRDDMTDRAERYQKELSDLMDRILERV